MKEIEKNKFPSVAKYNRKEDFERFDVDTLFFVFYNHPGTYKA